MKNRYLLWNHDPWTRMVNPQKSFHGTALRKEGRTMPWKELASVIRSDNGSPFANYRSPLGLSRLSAWWVAHNYSKLRRPWAQGAVTNLNCLPAPPMPRTSCVTYVLTGPTNSQQPSPLPEERDKERQIERRNAVSYDECPSLSSGRLFPLTFT
jgi:hypothetical protein